MIEDLAPDYKYPFSLATTIIDGSLHQHFINQHFVSITDSVDENNPSMYFKNLVSNLLNISNGK